MNSYRGIHDILQDTHMRKEIKALKYQTIIAGQFPQLMFSCIDRFSVFTSGSISAVIDQIAVIQGLQHGRTPEQG